MKKERKEQKRKGTQWEREKKKNSAVLETSGLVLSLGHQSPRRENRPGVS